MKARYKFLCEHSLGMALSAIEVYNKPDFKEREQVFAILMTTAWECLFKAKILKDNRNRIQVLWVKESNGRYKRKRGSGEHMTIGLSAAMRSCPLSPVVAENVLRLKDVRDAAIHLVGHSSALPSLVFALGTASLRNYARLAREWFSIDLGEYSLFILPVGFSYPFETFSLADVQREPEEIARLLASVAKAQDEGRASDDGYQLVCEVQTTFVSAKKVTEATDFTVAVDPTSKAVTVTQRRVRPIDQYPLTYREVLQKVKAALPAVKQHEFNAAIKRHGLKQDAKYATYNYRSKAEERRGATSATAVVYNEDAVRFLIEELGK